MNILKAMQGSATVTKYLLRRSRDGFTLIELIIVIMIVTILALASVPLLVAQIGKSREAEAKLALSSFGSAQQEYFFEKGSFADSLGKLSIVEVGKYYSYPEPSLLSNIVVKHEAVPNNASVFNIRHYSLGVYVTPAQSYEINLCQSDNPQTTAEVGNNYTDDCIAGTLIN